MKIIPLSEGLFTVDKTKLFIPFNENTDKLEDRPVGSLLVEIQPFIVITSKDVLLLDTGLGFNDAAEHHMQLFSNLVKANIRPEDVTKVLLSHLHKDHAGGISFEMDRNTLTLPNAFYYVQRRELDLAFQKGYPSYLPDELQVLNKSERVIFLEKDEGDINKYISYQVTGGHSPFHQVFWITENNETIFFGGDVAPQINQMKIRYKTKYDSDPDKALNLRREWWAEGKNKGWTFLFYHDLKTPFQKPL